MFPFGNYNRFPQMNHIPSLPSLQPSMPQHIIPNNKQNYYVSPQLEWKEVVMENGSVFYHNSKINFSTLEKPDEMKTQEEKVSGWSILKGIGGKEYYFNALQKISTWEEPEELKETRKKLAAHLNINKTLENNSKQNISNSAFKNEIIISEKEKEEEEKIELENLRKLSDSELKLKFKEFLKKMNINSGWKWEDTERCCSGKIIWKAIKTFSERKQLFTEYIRECKDKERDELKSKRDKNKLNFKILLQEDPTLNSLSKFGKYAIKYSSDERWLAIESRDREDLFEDYLDELLKREEEEKKIILKTKLEIYKEDLRCLKVIKWDDSGMDTQEKYEKIKIYIEWCEKRIKEDKEEYNRLNEEKQFLKRENLRELILKEAEQDTLTSYTKWSEFATKNKTMIFEMIGESEYTPKDVFNEFSKFLKEKYKKNKENLKNIIAKNNLKFSSETSLEEFKMIINGFDELKNISNSQISLLHDYIIYKCKEKFQEQGYKTEKKACKKFKSFLKKKKKLNEKFSDNLYKEIKSTNKFDLLSYEKMKELFEETKEDDGSSVSSNIILKKNNKDISYDKEEGEI